MIGFFGDFCRTIAKTCFGGGQPPAANCAVVGSAVVGDFRGDNAIIINSTNASPDELVALLREANHSLESRRADEGRSWREGEALRKASATAKKAITADQGVDQAAAASQEPAASLGAASKAAASRATASKATVSKAAAGAADISVKRSSSGDNRPPFKSAAE